LILLLRLEWGRVQRSVGRVEGGDCEDLYYVLTYGGLLGLLGLLGRERGVRTTNFGTTKRYFTN
jgi:hypothetical protein